jgi:glycosyltransferase involved in cell wall biosynthesis
MKTLESHQQSPLVTILIPAFNAEKTIERALRSVLAQRIESFEIVVVNDASNDGTVAVIESLGIKELRLAHHQENLGECGAMNTGLGLALGKYIAFLDADDEWLPNKLIKQIALLEKNPNMVFATCGCLFVDAMGKPLREFGLHPPSQPNNIWRDLLGASCVAKPCVVARADVIKATGGFDLALRVAGDQDMWIRLASQGEVGFIEEILVIVHDTPGSLTKVHAQRIADFVMPMVMNRISHLQDRLSPAEIRHILGVRYSFIGRNLYDAGMIVKGLGYIARGIAKGVLVGENLWYIITASPPARFVKKITIRNLFCYRSK